MMRINSKGIGLVEVILSLGIAVIVITSLVSLAVFTLRASQQSRYLLEGSKLASEEIELVRTFKDNSTTWSAFRTAINGCTSSSPCYINSGGTGRTGGKEGIDFMDRYFYAAQGASDQIYTITAVVEWRFGAGADKKTVIVSEVSNWRNK
ncbi:MAG: hypothetical protein RLY61_886 [Candidatus Parcubacteria bacterium]